LASCSYTYLSTHPTPFYPDGNVLLQKLEANVERSPARPSAGIVVQGSTGEAILLSDHERRDVLKFAMARLRRIRS